MTLDSNRLEVINDWDSFFCNVNESLASVFVNLGFFQVAPFQNQPKLAWLWIRLNNPRDDGLSRDEEFDTLCEYEDDLEDAINHYGLSHYVGRITTCGMRQFYFYIPATADFKEIVDEVLSKHQSYLFQLGEKPDPTWSQYFDLLYPGENGLEQIRKRRAEQ